MKIQDYINLIEQLITYYKTTSQQFIDSLNRVKGALFAELFRQDSAFSFTEKAEQCSSAGMDGEDILKFPVKKGEKEMFSIKDGKVRIKPNGSYEIRFRKFGVEKSFCATKLSVAQDKFRVFLKEFNKEFKKGNIVKGKTVSDVSDIYLDKYRRYELAANSFEGLQKLVKLHITPKLGHYDISKIQALQIQEVLTSLISEGKGRTAEGVHSYLVGLFRIAKNLGYIKNDVMAGVKIPKHYRKKGVALTLKEENDFIKKIKGDHYEPILLFLLYSGARVSEAIQFSFNDVNFIENTITIHTTKIKDKVNGADRVVPIFPKLKALLKTLNQDEEFPFLKMANKAGRKFKSLCPEHHLHELRHTFTTRCREAGIENEIVCLWTGHTFAGNTTSLVYTHFSMEYQQKTALLLNY